MNDLCFNAVDLYAAASPLESNRHYILYQKALDRFNAARRAAAIIRARVSCSGTPAACSTWARSRPVRSAAGTTAASSASA